MRKFFNKVSETVNSACTRAKAAATCVKKVVCDKVGDLTTNTLGAIILGIIFIGLLVLAINTIFPGVIQNLFSTMSTKLTAYMGTSTTGGTAGTFTALGG